MGQLTRHRCDNRHTLGHSHTDCKSAPSNDWVRVDRIGRLGAAAATFLGTGRRKIVQTKHHTRHYSGVIWYTRETRREVTAMDANAEDRWLSRQELADRYGVPAKTPAEWASKGTGPRYAKFGKYVRYRLSDVIDWESQRFAEDKRSSA